MRTAAHDGALRILWFPYAVSPCLGLLHDPTSPNPTGTSRCSSGFLPRPESTAAHGTTASTSVSAPTLSCQRLRDFSRLGCIFLWVCHCEAIQYPPLLATQIEHPMIRERRE